MTKKTIALVALAAAGIAGIILLENSFKQIPEEIIKEMNVKMAGLETVRTETKMNIEISDPDMDVFSIFMIFNSDTDKTDPENLKSAGDFDITLGVEGIQFTLKGEGITIGDDSYLKMATIPALPMIEPIFQIMGINISDFKKQWIKFDKDSMKNMFGTGMDIEMETSEEQQAHMQEALQELLITRDFYSVKQELPEEKIAEQSVYHYLVALEKEETKNLILDMFRIIGESQGEAFLPSDEELTEFSQNLDEFFDKTGGIDANLWIGKYDKYLYRFELDKTIDAGSDEEEETMIISIAMDFSNFNQPLNITTPEDFKSLEELFSVPDLGPMPEGMDITMPEEMYYYSE
ncbi:hypothetical protein KAR26_03605 [Candidatus Parcubacteria bacterium]|nr:hypothetical protein [Candidatus Parcubacteria bacterium]